MADHMADHMAVRFVVGDVRSELPLSISAIHETPPANGRRA